MVWPDSRLLRLTMSMAGVVLITWIGYSAIAVNATTAGFGYLLFVLVVAGAWGYLEASVSSILAAVLFNVFFFEPKLTITVADPHNWVAIFAFLTTALIASRLSTQARRRTSDALERQRDLERLYTFGRAILLIDDSEPFAKQLVRRLADAFELEAAALYDRRSGEIHRAGPAELEGVDAQLHEAALRGTEFADKDQNCVVTAVRLGADPIAGLALQGAHLTDSVLQSIANLVAIGLERAKAQALAHEMEAARRSEQLRTTLVDALAHELKTPLTSIRAVTTALLADPSHQPDNAEPMLRIADEEAARLEVLINNALELGHLDSEHIDVNLEGSDVGRAVGNVVDSMRALNPDRSVEFTCDADLHQVAFDRRLLTVAMEQILDNALKYSPPDRPIAVRILASDGEVAIEVTNHGGGIPEAERSRVFERFFRSPSVKDHVPGSGLGLSIARRIARAHKGDIACESRSGQTTFRFSFPAVSERVETRSRRRHA